MEINQLEHFKCLLEKGKPLDALLPLFLFVKKANLIENFSDTESTNKAQNLLNIAFETIITASFQYIKIVTRS